MWMNANGKPMDTVVQYNLRRLQYQAYCKPKGRPRASGAASSSEEVPPVCAICDESGGDVVRCISYTKPPEVTWKKKTVNEAAYSWFKQEKGCGKYVHLDCIRQSREYQEIYEGGVDMAEAQYAVIGFCPDCFVEMEAARADEVAPAPAAPTNDEEGIG